MNEERGKLLAEAFFRAEFRVGERKLRRVTAGTLLLLQVLGNPLFGEDAEEGKAEDAAVDLLGLCGFMWVHCAPMDEVIAAAEGGEEGKAVYRREARRLSLELGQEEMEALGAQFGKVLEMVNAASVRGIEEEGALPGKPVPSLTGSPVMSGDSEVTGTRPGSDGSFGSSRSSGGSSISTPGSGRTGSDARGNLEAGEVAEAPGISLPSLQGSESDG